MRHDRPAPGAGDDASGPATKSPRALPSRTGFGKESAAASAVLALIHNEPGDELVAETMDGAALGAAICQGGWKLVDADIDVRRLRVLLSAAGVVREPLTAADATSRCCLALTTPVTPADVLTADRACSDLDLPIQVRLIR